MVKSLTVGGRDLKLLSVITDAVMEKGFNYNLSSCYLFTGKVGKFNLFGPCLDGILGTILGRLLYLITVLRQC